MRLKIVTVQLNKKETEILEKGMDENDLSAGKFIRETLMFYDAHKDCTLKKETEK